MYSYESVRSTNHPGIKLPDNTTERKEEKEAGGGGGGDNRVERGIGEPRNMQ